MAAHPVASARFIKTNLWFSEEFAQRKNDPAYLGRKALDPALLPRVVRKAHASSLKVSARVVRGADFHNALAAGVDEIVHVPAALAVREVEERIYQLAPGSLDAPAMHEIAGALMRFNPADPSSLPVRGEDARLAARRGTVVITTFALAATARARPEFESAWRAIEVATLRLLNNHRRRAARGRQ